MRLRWLALLAGSAGCGVLSGLDGLTVGDASGADASPTSDASLDVGSCEAGACGAPAGFQPVLFATGSVLACPPNTTQLDVVADSVAPNDACSCNCNYQPACLPQPLVYGTGSTCTTQTKANLVLDGGCNQDNQGPAPAHVSVGPFAPTNPCTNTVTTNGAPSDTKGRICTISSCSACNPSPGFELCFAQIGNVQCPSGFKPHVVGASSSLQCSPCTSCSSTAQCTGTLEVFNDFDCLATNGQVPVDGTCQTTNTGSFGGLRYVPTIVAGVCTPGTSTATIAFTEQTTVCCP